MGVVTTHTTVIDDIPYACKTFPAFEGLSLIVRMAKLVGEKPLTLIIGTTTEEQAAIFEEPSVLAGILMGVIEGAGEDGPQIALDLLKYTTSEKCQVGDVQIPGSVFQHFDHHFAGRYKHLFEVCKWVAQVSFVRL